MWGHKWAYGQDRYTVVVSKRELEMIKEALLESSNPLGIPFPWLVLHATTVELLTKENVPAPDQPGGKPHV